MTTTTNVPSRGRRLTWMDGLFALTTALMLVNLYLIFIWSPTEANQGNVYRLFYLHVPAAWIAYLAFLLVFIFSVLRLWRRNQRWDRYAYSCAELGVVFTSVTLVTGIVWAKPINNIWWEWEPRLTTTALLWFIYIGYLMVGAYADSQTRAPRLRAVIGILGFIVVPINYMSVYLWETVHVKPVTVGEEANLPRDMWIALLFSLVTFTLLFFVLVKTRVMLRKIEEVSSELES